MTDWQDMSTAPKDGTEFLALQDGEIYVARYTKQGELSWRTHTRREPASYRQIDTEMDGQPVRALVPINEPWPEYFEHHWTTWTRGFDFKPTGWLPAPPTAAKAK